MSDQSKAKQYKKLNEAFNKAFPTKLSLKKLLKLGLEKELDQIVPDGSSSDIVFELINAAESQGWLNDLISIAKENPYFKLLLEAEEGVNFEWPQEINWTGATEKYADYIESKYGKLFVLGQANLKPIDEIYTALNLLEKVSAQRRYAPENLHDLFLKRDLLHEEDDRCDGIKIVNKDSNLFILGKPGAGKTTFLKHLAIKAIRKQLNSNTDPKVPIFLSLHSYSRSKENLLESIEHELSGCDFPKHEFFVKNLLHSGHALVLFDGFR